MQPLAAPAAKPEGLLSGRVTALAPIRKPVERLLASPWFVPAVAAFTVVVGLLPVLTTSFGFIDDYSVLYQKLTDPGPTVDAALVQGRPIAGLLQGLAFLGVRDIHGLVWLRLFSVGCLAFAAVVICVGLVGQMWSRSVAFALATAMLVLPSTAAMAAWAILLMGPAALLLGVLAAMTTATLLDLVSGEKLLTADGARAVALPLGLLSLALMAYQPAAMVFWPVSLLILLAPVRRSKPLRHVARGAVVLLVVGTAASAVGYLAVKVGVAYVGGDAPRTALVSDLAEKAHYVTTQALPRVLDPLSLTPRPLVALVTGMALLVLLMTAPLGSAQRRFVFLLLWLAAGVLSYLPSLATGENWASARSLSAAYFVPLVGLALVAQAWRESLFRAPTRRLLAAGLAAVAALSSVIFSTHHLQSYWTGPQGEELARARAAIAPAADLMQSADVAVLRSDFTQTLAPGFSFDEGGVPSSYAPWVPVPLTQLIVREETGRWLPSIARRERDASLPRGTVVVDFGALLDPTAGAAVRVVTP